MSCPESSLNDQMNKSTDQKKMCLTVSHLFPPELRKRLTKKQDRKQKEKWKKNGNKFTPVNIESSGSCHVQVQTKTPKNWFVVSFISK